MSIYDDINIIKREGLDNIEYDSQGNVVSNKGTIEDAIAGGLIKDSSSDAFLGSLLMLVTCIQKVMEIVNMIIVPIEEPLIREVFRRYTC